MASLPAEILLGIYLGVLVGIIPALVAWGLGFSFKYITGVTLPGFGVTILQSQWRESTAACWRLRTRPS